MTIRLTYWQVASLLLMLLKLTGSIYVSWFIVLAPLAVHIWLRRAYLKRHHKSAPVWSWFE